MKAVILAIGFLGSLHVEVAYEYLVVFFVNLNSCTEQVRSLLGPREEIFQRIMGAYIVIRFFSVIDARTSAYVYPEIAESIRHTLRIRFRRGKRKENDKDGYKKPDCPRVPHTAYTCVVSSFRVPSGTISARSLAGTALDFIEKPYDKFTN